LLHSRIGNVQHSSANPPYSIPLYCSDVDSELADHEDDGDNFVVRFARNHLSLPDKWSHLLGVPRSAYDSGHETGRIHGSMARGWALTKQSWAVLCNDRSLAVFPILSTIIALMALVAV
jgi:hypothetical protein